MDKKGRDVKRLLISTVVLALSLMTVPASAQSAKEAILALKKIEASCQSGISYMDYGPAVSDAKAPLNSFAGSEQAKKSPELTDSLNKVMSHYEYAGKIWQLRFNPFFQGYGIIEVNSSLGQEISASYPKASAKDEKYIVEEILPVVWQAAAKDLETVMTLYTASEGDMSSEIENSIKENKKTEENTVDKQVH